MYKPNKPSSAIKKKVLIASPGVVDNGRVVINVFSIESKCKFYKCKISNVKFQM